MDERGPADLFLTEEAPPKRGRPRWVDGLGLAVVVAAMVAVGVLGDRGSKDERPSPTTTTSTTSPFRRGIPYDQLSTTTTTAPSTTPTVGALLPLTDGQTGALLASTDGTTLTIIDVDRHQVISRQVAAQSMGVLGTPTGFVVTGAGRFVLWPAVGEPSEVVATVDQGTPLLGEGDRFWAVHPDGDGATATAYDLHGERIDGAVHVPAGSSIVGTWAGGLVAAGHSALTAIEAGDSALHELGTGDFVASRGDQLARVRCPLLRCALELVDVPSGRARRLAGAPAEGDLQGTFSPDGRWLAYVLGGPGANHVVVVELSSGKVTESDALPDTYAQLAFAPDSRTLFRLQEALVCATVLATGRTGCSDALVHPYGPVGVAPAPDR